MDKLKGKKTLIYAALVAVSGFLASPQMIDIAAENPGVTGVAVSLGIAILRVFTNSPMFKKD